MTARRRKEKPLEVWKILMRGEEIDPAAPETALAIREASRALHPLPGGLKGMPREKVAISLPAGFVRVARLLGAKKGWTPNRVISALVSEVLNKAYIDLWQEVSKAGGLTPRRGDPDFDDNFLGGAGTE
jgi:hypothetical protein